MNSSTLKIIWAGGSPEGIAALRDWSIDQVLRFPENGSLIAVSEDSIKLVWNGVQITTCATKTGLWVQAPQEEAYVDRNLWNSSLESFYVIVIDPTKDRTGEVAAGIGFEQDDETE